LLKGQQTLENLGFVKAEPQTRSNARASKSDSTPGEKTAGVKVKVEDNSPLISPCSSSLPISEFKDDVHMQQETPDPPAQECDVKIWQESLTPPPLCFDESRSLSMHIHEESVMLLPLFFNSHTKRKSSRKPRN